MDQQQREILARQSPATLQRVEQGQPLGLADIKALAKAGVSDEVIISQIRNSRVVYRLTTAEIIDLKDSGVSQKVIDFMINSPSLSAATAATRATVTKPRPLCMERRRVRGRACWVGADSNAYKPASGRSRFRATESSLRQERPRRSAALRQGRFVMALLLVGDRAGEGARRSAMVVGC